MMFVLFTIDCGDKMIEVVGVENSLQLAQIKGGMRSSGRRLAQCSSVVIRYSLQGLWDIYAVCGSVWCVTHIQICTIHLRVL